MNQGSFTPNQNKSTDNILVITLTFGIVGVILLTLILNYFNILPFSRSYPKVFGWLPHQKSTVQTPKIETKPIQDNNSFTPSLNPTSQKGKLVKNATVVYTLEGKITKITPNGSNYNLEITSLDGSQVYNAINIGGPDILRGSKSGGEIKWSALKPGDDVLINVSVSMDASGKETVSIGQILVNNR